MNLRILGPGDAPLLENFLRAHAASSLFLRSNLRTGAGGTYAAVIDDGCVSAVVAHAANGNAIFQAPTHAGALLRLAVKLSARPLKGLVGPWQQVSRAREDVGLMSAPTLLCSKEDLFEVELVDLRVPDRLRLGDVTCRRATDPELDLLAAWRRDYRVALLNEVDGGGLLAECRAQIGHSRQAGYLFVLDADAVPVSMCAFNARLPDCVQIGGVWTPPEHRNRGYARAVVAGALLHAKREGIVSSVLFTGETNSAAKAAYEALGYTRIGDYAIVLFRDAVTLGA